MFKKKYIILTLQILEFGNQVFDRWAEMAFPNSDFPSNSHAMEIQLWAGGGDCSTGLITPKRSDIDKTCPDYSIDTFALRQRTPPSKSQPMLHVHTSLLRHGPHLDSLHWLSVPPLSNFPLDWTADPHMPPERRITFSQTKKAKA